MGTLFCGTTMANNLAEMRGCFLQISGVGIISDY